MGVPAFFRWLTRKYPSVIVDAVEDKRCDLDGSKLPVDTTASNPNFQEFDNLYLDMNGIIHPCTHPEDRPAPQTEEEMFELIFLYIDRLFAIVRPRRLLYMAIDGVAPRAKMNQQRSRRFRSSKEAAEKIAQIAETRARLESEGFPLPPSKDSGQHFDSNCITPGTPFMSRLADALRYYIHLRLTEDPGWANILVILSDANAPGEGEHKIMDFIRRQRASPNHDPNTVHCLCGADADLIMLGLATHEPNFNIIREEFVPNQQRPCELCGLYGHDLKDCSGLPTEDVSECQSTPLQKETNFIFVRLPVLREYLARELLMPNAPFSLNLERLIDDWVFMCFFVGNDFLPHLPSLEIRENAIDRLINLYKEMLFKTKGYLTNSGDVYIERAQMILNKLGDVEDEIFKSRQDRELHFRRRNKEKRRHEKAASAPSFIPQGGSLLAPYAKHTNLLTGVETRVMARDARMEAIHYSNSKQSSGLSQAVGQSNPRKRKCDEKLDLDDSDEEPYDEVKLWESGWKERYYQSKFQVDANDIGFKRKVALAYVEGLCWVLQYYYQGCQSWNWYYPFHYAPFASDFESISMFKPDFSAPTEPFKPLQQLMAVFPAASRMHLPEPWQELMISPDSPIIDFYPDDFVVDLNGKKFAWQGVALLPFVNQKRLLEVLEPMESKLDAFALERNSKGQDCIFVGRRHQFYKFVEQIYESDDKSDQTLVQIDPKLTSGISGLIGFHSKAVGGENTYPSPFITIHFYDINNTALMSTFKDPDFASGYKFKAALLPGAVELPPTLKDRDMDSHTPYRPQIGFSRDVPRQRLSDAGRRMLGHATPWPQHGPRRSQSQAELHAQQGAYPPRGYPDTPRFRPYQMRGYDGANAQPPHWQRFRPRVYANPQRPQSQYIDQARGRGFNPRHRRWSPENQLW